MADKYVPLRESLQSKLQKLSPLPSNCCIYRVPERLRQINEKAYTPQVISIGPLHHGSKNLQSMQQHKQRYLQEFLQRTKISLDEFVQLIKNKEAQVRGCYADEIHFESDQFVEMIIVDATFIVEQLLRYRFHQLRTQNDHIFNRPYLIEDIWYDMWLIENQLPFFVLEDVFSLAKNEINSQLPIISSTSIVELTYDYFKSLEAVKGNLKKFAPENEVRIEHFTDFLRICHLPLKPKPGREQQTEAQDNEMAVKTSPSVIDLHQAGVKFRLRPNNELFDIDFKNGILEIPKLKLQLETESLFRNMIAYEQRHYSENYINDYVFVIHHLVNTPKDVELLVQKGIIENWLPDKEGASTLINNLSRGTTLMPENFYFSGLCKQLNVHCRSPRNRWRANLKQNYFNTPWAGISVVGAVFLLVLTVIQSVCSVLQVMSPPKNCS